MALPSLHRTENRYDLPSST